MIQSTKIGCVIRTHRFIIAYLNPLAASACLACQIMKMNALFRSKLLYFSAQFKFVLLEQMLKIKHETIAELHRENRMASVALRHADCTTPTNTVSRWVERKFTATSRTRSLHSTQNHMKCIIQFWHSTKKKIKIKKYNSWTASHSSRKCKMRNGLSNARNIYCALNIYYNRQPHTPTAINKLYRNHRCRE